MDAENEYRRQRFESYAKERELLRTEALEVSGRFDQTISLLSGGALALSITFIEKIAPNPVWWTLFFLGLAWLALIGALLLGLFALSSSQTGTSMQIRRVDDDWRQYLKSLPELVDVPESPRMAESSADIELRAVITRRMNSWSRWLLSGGIFLICAFSIVNVIIKPPQKTVMSEPIQAKTIQGINESKGSFISPTNILPPAPPAKPATPSVMPTAAPVATPVAVPSTPKPTAP